MMKLDSYEKASLDILNYLSADPTILIINSMLFRLVIAAAPSNKLASYNVYSYEYVDIQEYVPNVLKEIEKALPHPEKPSLNRIHFVTELVGQYSQSWIPISSPDYEKTLKVSFTEDIEMVEWQRYLRARRSQDAGELTVLSVDPSQQVRDLALERLKTL